MRFLNRKTIQTVDPSRIQDAVKYAYTLAVNEAFNMPDRMHVADKENTLLLMPCFSEKYFATKLVSVFPDAPSFGLPAVNGVVVLADNASGNPLAIMDGAALTAQRTGAVGGLGVACLAPDSVRTAGILGAGVQGMSQARYLLANREIETLYIQDLFPESAIRMRDSMALEFPDVSFRIAESAEQLVDAAQVIIAATTSTEPVFEAGPDQVRGKTFISIGSYKPEMKEFPDAVIAGADRVFVDTPFAARESGDVCIPLEKGVVSMEKIEPFAPLVQAPINREGKTYFFKSVGMALFDLAVASALFELANEKKLGQTLDW